MTHQDVTAFHPSPRHEASEHLYLVALNEGALYPKWLAFARERAPDSVWATELRLLAGRLISQGLADRAERSAENVNFTAARVRDYYIDHVKDDPAPGLADFASAPDAVVAAVTEPPAAPDVWHVGERLVSMCLTAVRGESGELVCYVGTEELAEIMVADRADHRALWLLAVRLLAHEADQFDQGLRDEVAALVGRAS